MFIWMFWKCLFCGLDNVDVICSLEWCVLGNGGIVLLFSFFVIDSLCIGKVIGLILWLCLFGCFVYVYFCNLDYVEVNWWFFVDVVIIGIGYGMSGDNFLLIE